MLCPEVFDFKAPQSNFLVQKSDRNEKTYLNTINNFPYTHLVSVVLPDTTKVPETLSKALVEDCEYYKITDLNLSDLVSKKFINSFVKSGNLYGLSVNSRIDCDNCVSLTPSGYLILNLNKTSFQSLGLEGVVSHFYTRTKARYIVSINLKIPYFVPGKANYDRTKKRLEQFRETFDLIVNWQPPSKEICASSVAKYFNDLGYETHLCKNQHFSNTVYSLNMPILNSDVDYYDIVEWLGMVCVSGDFDSGGCDKFLSSYQTPEPNKCVEKVKTLQWRGFFNIHQITKFLKEIRQYENNVEWISIYVQGFSDSPISWDNQEHHFYTNGDNGYILIFDKDNVTVCTQTCGRKRYANNY